MKTNANFNTVIKAVQNVSNTLFEGNVIFRKEPEYLTKNVLRFTLKTKDANKPGSLNLRGQKQPKANWEVHQEVVKEIFRLEPKENVYVDTIAGRMYNDSVRVEEVTQEEEVIPEKKMASSTSIKGPKKFSKKQHKAQMNQFMRALKYVFEHKNLLDEVKI